MSVKRFTGSYSSCNPNFTIHNLGGRRISAEYLPAVCILKNLLLRGTTTMMSRYLQDRYGSIHKEKSFNEPFLLIAKTNLNWDITIKGSSETDYYPARTFLYDLIDRDLPQYSFIKYLIVPELEINEITQSADTKFVNQCVDFYLPQSLLVIEIDGQQHKLGSSRVVDRIRDEHLAKSDVQTVRIDTHDLEKRNDAYHSQIQKIKSILDKTASLPSYEKQFKKPLSKLKKNIVTKKLLPAAILRFQILLLELVENGYLSFEDEWWDLEVINHDVTNYEEDSINDLFEWIEQILGLHKIQFSRPQFKITNVDQFTESNNIKVDFSLLQRWTDDVLQLKNVIFVRTDYASKFYDKERKSRVGVNYFKLITTKPVKYNLHLGDDEGGDYERLQFLLRNLFDHDDFVKGQVQIIKNALERKDTIGLLPTGGGKSLTYQMACLLQPCISFVVCPIKSLMYDQVDELKEAYIDQVDCITGDMSGPLKESILDKFGQGKYFCVFISPERFQNEAFRARLAAISANMGFAIAVIDEVHCLSEWGHDFRTSYLNLAKTIGRFCPNIRFLGLTATASVNVLNDIQIEFNVERDNIKTLPDYTRPELEFRILKDGGQKYGKLVDVIRKYAEAGSLFDTSEDRLRCGLIFTPHANGTFGCFGLSNSLKHEFKQTVNFFAGTKPKEYDGTDDQYNRYKYEVQTDYKKNKFSLLTATKAFGMGVNKKNIGFTVHYGIPSSMEALYQEAGRAGRDKKDSQCYVLLSEETNSSAVNQLFDPSITYEQMNAIHDKVGSQKRDLFRQLFLYLNGLDPISDEVELLVKLHNDFSISKSENIIYSDALGVDKSKVEKGIYRLSNLGVVEDWVVVDFFNGVYKVEYSNYDGDTIKDSLLKFIRKYTDDFKLDDHPERRKYTSILNDESLGSFEKYAKILLQWSYDKFGANRRESLKNVYYACRDYEDTNIGREGFRRSLEAYFKFTEATYILQYIAENNNRDVLNWFTVFYDKSNKLVQHDALLDLEGNLQRYLESYQNNTGLNFLTGLTALSLGKPIHSSDEKRFDNAFAVISGYPEGDYDDVIDQTLLLYRSFGEQAQEYLLSKLYAYSIDEGSQLELAEKFGDTAVILSHYNKRIEVINNKLTYGIRTN